MNAFHKFLLKHRRYCEKCNVMTLTPATEVIRENGHNVAVCKIHAEPFHPIETGLRRAHQHQIEGTHANFDRYIAGDR